jgi:ABC-type phosphate transport system permease subunit
LAIRQMVYGMAFVAGLLAAVMAIPMVAKTSPDVITHGVSPLVSLAGFH